LLPRSESKSTSKAADRNTAQDQQQERYGEGGHRKFFLANAEAQKCDAQERFPQSAPRGVRRAKVAGGEGKGAGQFNVPHSIVIDGKGLLHIADRSNQRIQVFDGEGNFVREHPHPGTPCGLAMMRDRQHIMMAHGHAGKIIKLDLNGRVLGSTGGQGKAPNRYGEAHYLALDRKEDIYVADTLNWRVQKLVKK
jgi:hypothetical protein